MTDSYKIPVGEKIMLINKLRSTGYPGGVLGDALASGNTSGSYITRDVVSAGYAPGSREVINLDTGGKRVGSVAVGNAPQGPFTFEMLGQDKTLTALIGASVADATTSTKRTRVSANPNSTSLPFFMLIFFQQVKVIGDDVLAQGNKWRADIFPIVTIEELQQGFSGNQQTNPQFQVTPMMGKRDYVGVLFSATTMALAKHKTDYYRLEDLDYPFDIVTHIVPDTSAAGFTTPYKPISSTVTVNASENELARNGVIEAATSVNTSSGAVVGATGTAGQVLTLAYGSLLEELTS